MVTLLTSNQYRETVRQIMLVITARSVQTKLLFSPHYLLLLAYAESTMYAGAYNSRSTAAGLFQFTIDTWTNLWQRRAQDIWNDVQHFANLAAQNKFEGTPAPLLAAIQELGEHLRNPMFLSLSQSLHARLDPLWSTLLAIELTNENVAYVDRRVDYPIGESAGALYLTHFLGAPDASKLLVADRAGDPENVIARWPSIVKANPHLTDKSVGEVLDWASTFILRGQDWLLRHVADLYRAATGDTIFTDTEN